ncbi:MAG: SLC13 family permease [Thermoanaerobaculia bacterium]
MSLAGPLAEGYVFAVLCGSLLLFLWGKWRYDVVALLALLAVGLADVLPRDQLFAGFGHPAVITVAAVLVVGRGLAEAGVVDLLASWLARAGEAPLVRLVLLTLLVTVASAFMNNVGALALLMPVAVRMARGSGQSPSLFLMPMAFGSLLGGLMTLIGTPPNIILATLRGDVTGEPFRMFDFAPVGAVVAGAGAVLVVAAARWLVPRREGAVPGELFRIEDYLTELQAPEGSGAVGRTVRELVEGSKGEVLVVAVVRRGRWQAVVSAAEKVAEGDLLVVEADRDALETLVERFGLEPAASRGIEEEIRGAGGVDLQEAVVLPGSVLVGRSSKSIRMRQRFGVNLLAVSRQGSSLRERLADVEVHAGDVLLLEGPEGTVREAMAAMGCVPLAAPQLRVRPARRVLLGTGLFAGAVVATATGVVRVEVAFVGVAVLMVLAGVVRLRHAYESIDWPVILLLGAMIPVGQALEVTGGADRLAGWLLTAGRELPETGAVALVLVVSMLLSNVINNAAAAVLLAPVAVGLAQGLGASADPFLMAVAVGASCAFLTPIGHQSNTLVMGPGGYGFGDYWRLGLPLSLLVAALGAPLIVWIWPLGV